LYLSGAKECQTRGAAGRPIVPWKSMRYAVRDVNRPSPHHFQRKMSQPDPSSAARLAS
jgi:hypothetical protein